jgi:hypothetical protein
LLCNKYAHINIKYKTTFRVEVIHDVLRSIGTPSLFVCQSINTDLSHQPTLVGEDLGEFRGLPTGEAVGDFGDETGLKLRDARIADGKVVGFVLDSVEQTYCKHSAG